MLEDLWYSCYTSSAACNQSDLGDVSGGCGDRGAAGGLRGAGHSGALFVLCSIVCHLLDKRRQKTIVMTLTDFVFACRSSWSSVLVLPRPSCSSLVSPSTRQTGHRETETLAELLPLKTHRRGSWWARQGPLWWTRHWVRSWRLL